MRGTPSMSNAQLVELRAVIASVDGRLDLIYQKTTAHLARLRALARRPIR